MKAKKKKINVQAFFIDHCEKIVLTLMIPIALFIAWQGTKFPPLPWQPDALSQVAAEANRTIEASSRKAADEGVAITAYDVKAEWIKAKIYVDLYRTDTKWMPSLFPERVKRGVAEVFTVENLRSSSGLGAIAVGNNPLAGDLGVQPGATHQGRHWAVVTGLIPVKKQLDFYVGAYSSSVYTSPERDTPHYFFYDVERAEVLPTSTVDNLVWTKLNVFESLRKDDIIWAGTSLDPVDPTYLAPAPSDAAFPMAYPLPPVAKRFGEDVTHPPLIPMLTDTQMRGIEYLEQMQKKQRQRMLDFNEQQIFTAPPFAAGAASDLNRASQEDDEVLILTVDNYLFRFFDFTVEIGKTYRYRVRLHLANPNYSLAPHLVEETDFSKDPYLVTEFSSPSNQVTIPLGSRILVSGTISPSSIRTPWAEPSTSLYAIYFDDKSDGAEWYYERLSVSRGQTVNYANAEATRPSSTTSSPDMTELQPPVERGPRNQRNPRPPAPTTTGEKKTINIVSEVCVLDIYGGTSLLKMATTAPDMRTPGRVLVLEPSGAMVLRKVEADLVEIEQVKNPTAVVGGAGRNFGVPIGGDI